MSDELVAFLRARYDEDESAARECARVYPPPWDMSDRGWAATVRADEPDFRIVTELEQWQGQPDGAWLGSFVEHIARHDPARVLREVDAKRHMLDRIIAWKHQEVEDCWYSCPQSNEGCCDEDRGDQCTCWVGPVRERFLRLLALPDAGHPDYREEWRP